MDHKNKILDRKKLKAAWQEFIKTGKVKHGVIRDEILESWQRCKSHGLNPHVKRAVTNISEGEKNKIITQASVLIETSRPFLKSLFELIKSLEMVVYLTDKDAFILDAMGEGEIWEYSKARVDIPGGCFGERYIGTNAVAMALALDRPYQMIAEEHYLKFIHLATCAAAPIHDETGAIIGSLDLTASYEMGLKHPHTLGMIAAAAKVIENQLRVKAELERSFLANQYLNASIESMSTGVIIISQANLITHINPAAERILGISASTISDKSIKNVIKNEIILGALQEDKRLKDHEIILSESIIKRRCLVTLKSIPDIQGKRMGTVLFLKELKELQQLVQKVTGLQAQYTFQDIMGESKEIKKTIEIARSVAKSQSSVIIEGESGTGKEMLAQSIHNAGPTSKGPFLAINCASIPHDLIESELFGYEPGTFTGGLRGGKSGKLEMAHGGTLFLDEINAMSLEMQAKLLRILEEKKFLRLGGETYFMLEARIIAATNKNLLQGIERGSFRSDLYYRLSVFEIHVPPLRDRKGDIKLLSLAFIRTISAKLGKKVDGISPEALEYLESTSWPGNARQLKNWIERAVNLTNHRLLNLEDFTWEGHKQEANPDGAPISITKSFPSLNKIEKDTIKAVLEECQGNISQASVRLGIGRATFYRKLKKYNLHLLKNILHETIDS